jgi:AraC-like DNA-binding protein
MALSILVVRGLVEGVEQAGTPRPRFLAAAGYDAAWLGEGETRLSVEEYDRLVELAIEITGDQALGLHMAEAANATTYSLVAHLITYAATMRQAVQSYLRYHRLLTDRSAYRLMEQGTSSTLAFDVPLGTQVCQRFHAELTLAGLFRMVQFFGGRDGIHRVSFEHERPEHAAEYARLFHGLERFKEPTSGVTFDSELLDRPQVNADTGFHAALEAHAQQRVSELVGQTTYRDRVLQYLLERATIEQRKEMNDVARDIGVSVRTLRRRLQDEGESYSDLSKKALATRAERLVADAGRTIDETAYMLGFSDRSAFHRAFKRWTGMTPNEYRRQRTLGKAVMSAR